MEEQLALADYFVIARRRWKLLVGTFLLLLLAAILVTVAMPPLYQASGLILVESQQIPAELIKSTVTSYADERVAFIQQRVMTRENLLKIIDKYGLFAEEREKTPVTELVGEMRERVKIELVDTEERGYREGRMNIAFRVGFEHNRPEIAFQVANELVTLFLEENVKSRTERAIGTTVFLTEEASKLKDELEKIEAQLAEAKQKYSDALPEHLDLHREMLDRADVEDKEAAREIRALEEERRFLELELAAVRRGDRPTASSGPAQELAQARAELATKRGIYSPNHPDLKYLERKVAALSGADGSGSSAAGELDAVRVQARIAAADTRIASLKTQREQVKKRIEELQKVIIRTPQVERELQTLSRDHENALKKYQELKDKEIQAKFAESLEEERKAERFSVLEPPVLPERPIKPNRKKALATGVVLALAGSGGSFLLVESLDQTLRGPQSLSKILRQAPLVRIPYIETLGERHSRQRKVLYALVVLLMLILAVAAAVHLLYLPLDQVWLKLLARLA